MRFVAAGCSALVALAACSDTPVSPNALRSQAAHFDSLATLQGPNSPTGDNTRFSSLEVIANALARGAQPALVTMTIAGMPVTVHLVGVESVSPSGGVDDHLAAAGWITSDADTTILVTVIELSTGFIDQTVALAIGDSSEGTPTYPPQFTFSQQNTNGSCTNYPILNELANRDAPCHLVLGTISFSAVPETFQGSPLLLPVDAAIVSPTVTFGIAQLTGGSL